MLKTYDRVMITYASMTKNREASVQAIAELQRLATAKKMLSQTELDNRCKGHRETRGPIARF